MATHETPSAQNGTRVAASQLFIHLAGRHLASRAALILCAAAALTAGACGSDGGEKAGDAGTKVDGGLFPPACTKQVVPKTANIINDFSNAPDGKKVSWGYGGGDQFSGFSYQYQEPAITTDMTTGAWKVGGMVNTYSGFGFGFSCAVDASMFTGVSFNIKGDVGTSGHLTMTVATSPNDVNMEKDAESFGTCVPKTSMYDGTCQAPMADVSVTETANTVKLKWADFKRGAPQASVSPDSISRMAWAFDWTDGAVPFPVDVTIDDVVFTID
jgi:hypothetical protein